MPQDLSESRGSRACQVASRLSTKRLKRYEARRGWRERNALKRLGCDATVPADGVRRFICTSKEFGRALSAKRRQWAACHYSYRMHEIDGTVLLELGPPSSKALPNNEMHLTTRDSPTAAPRR